MVVRDVTATCPPAPVVIDRSFAAQPPACLLGSDQTEIPDGLAYAEWMATAVGKIKSPRECMIAVAEWLETERDARNGETDEQ